MDEIDLTRAETVQPPDVDWQDVVTYVPLDPGDVPVVLPRRVVEGVIRDLGAMRLDAVLASDQAGGGEAHRLQRVLRQFLGGALAALLLAVGLVAATPTTQAQAMEGPQPDPAAAVYKVVLSGPTVTLRVPLVLTGTSAAGEFCGSVYGPDPAYGMARVGHACSYTRFVTVTVTLASAALRYGPRNTLWLVDDSSPDGETAAVVDARRASRFGVGMFTDMGRGDLAVRVPVTLYSPSIGRWVGQSRSPVQVQEATRRGWRTRATLTTNPPGLATGIVHLGGGRHVIRVVRPLGATVWGTTGRTRLVTITTEPLDIN